MGDSVHSLLLNMVQSLVDKPDCIKIENIQSGQTTVYTLSVHKSDLGKVIGKQGRNAVSLRTLVIAAATKLGRKAILNIDSGE